MERKERTAAIVIVTILFFFTILNNSLAEEDYTYIVDKNGTGDYTNIQDAIDNAAQGSTIYVKSGEYSEILDIRKDIRLLGEDKKTTIINPISNKNKYAVRLGAPGALIESLSITNGAPGLYSSGIRVAADNTKIIDCNIYSNPVGVAIWTSENLIKNCVFYDCSDEGIALLGSQYSQCGNNKIINCLFYDNCDGIELQYSSGNTIENCEFYDNSHSGIDAIVSSNDKNIISNCKIYNNRAQGIYLSDSNDNKITNCQISDNDDGNVVEVKNSNNNQIEFSAYVDQADKTENEYQTISNDNNIISRVVSKIYDILKLVKQYPFFI